MFHLTRVLDASLYSQYSQLNPIPIETSNQGSYEAPRFEIFHVGTSGPHREPVKS